MNSPYEHVLLIKPAGQGLITRAIAKFACESLKVRSHAYANLGAQMVVDNRLNGWTRAALTQWIGSPLPPPIRLSINMAALLAPVERWVVDGTGASRRNYAKDKGCDLGTGAWKGRRFNPSAIDNADRRWKPGTRSRRGGRVGTDGGNGPVGDGG